MKTETSILCDIKALTDLEFKSSRVKNKIRFYKECLSIVKEFEPEYLKNEYNRIKYDMSLWNKRRREYAKSEPKPTKAKIKELYRGQLKVSRKKLKGLKYLIN